MLNACAAMSEYDLQQPLKKDEAVSIIGMETIFDGRATNDGGGNCMLFRESVEDKSVKTLIASDEKYKYYIIKSDPVELKFYNIQCLKNKVLYNKARTYKFSEPIAIQAKAGQINYAGHVLIDFQSDTFKAGDMFMTGMGGIAHDDKAAVTMKLFEDTDAAKAILEKEYPVAAESLPFNKSLIKSHPQIIR